MELVSFTVQRYRSIVKAHKLPIERVTVFVGPNNEGKSNILKALVTAMKILSEWQVLAAVPNGIPRLKYLSQAYEWKRDYPIQLQKSEPEGSSEFIMEFRLSSDEIAEFRKHIKSEVNQTLPIRITIGQQMVDVTVYKKGPGSRALSKKSRNIATFVSKLIHCDYVPAVRTALSAQRIVDELVSRELQDVESDPQMIEAMNVIKRIQQPILDKLQSAIHATLKQFLPAVKSVTFRVEHAKRLRALRQSCEIIVDDGIATPLNRKGDGAQSLAALGIMRHASEQETIGQSIILALEEPESHLHPKAMHALRDVIEDLASKQQVVITTHCPLFIQRNRLQSNVIVNNRKARPAKSISEIRDVLGVRSSDNLRHADVVLLVEGDDDATALTALLRDASPELRVAIDNNTLAIDTLNGGTNLGYKAGLVKDALCLCHAFLDSDKAAQKGFDDARRDGVMSDRDVNFCNVQGLDEAEFEDMIEQSLYEPMLQNSYRVSLHSPKFKGRKKWSDRLRDAFTHQGKQWSGRVEMEIKCKLAELVAASPEKALNAHRRHSFDALQSALIERLKETTRARD